MANIAIARKQSGRLSLSGTSATTAATDVITNATLVAACEEGPLKSLLSSTYADLAAFLDAAASAGLMASLASETGVTMAWAIAANLPVINVADSASPSPLAVRVSLAHSAIR